MTSYSNDPRVAFAENWWGEAAGPDLMARVASAPRDHLHEYRRAARSQDGFVPGSHAKPALAPLVDPVSYVHLWNHPQTLEWYFERMAAPGLEAIAPRLASLLLLFDKVYVQDPLFVEDAERMFKTDLLMVHISIICLCAGLWGEGLTLVDAYPTKPGEFWETYALVEEIDIRVRNHGFDDGALLSGTEWLIEPGLLRGMRAAVRSNFKLMPAELRRTKHYAIVADAWRENSALRFGTRMDMLSRAAKISLGSLASLKDVQLARNNEGVLCDLRTGLSAALRRLGEVDPLDRASVDESMAFVANELSPLSSRLQGAAQKKVLRSVLQEELRPLLLRIPVAAGLGLATGNPWLAGATVAIDTFAEMLPKHARARDSTEKTASAVGRILSLE